MKIRPFLIHRRGYFVNLSNDDVKQFCSPTGSDQATNPDPPLN
jgi:hypothetical protein